MIVDDHSRMRALLRRVLNELDGEFIECDDGAEAVSTYGRVKPDWVLLDVSMPMLDGLSAAKEITSTYPEARILIVTEDGEPEMGEAARKAGALGCVQKQSVTALGDILRAASEAGTPANRRKGSLKTDRAR